MRSRASEQRTKITPNKFPLFRCVNLEIRTIKTQTYMNHKMAELPSAFLVNSHANSRLTGSMVIEETPMRVIMANKPPMLCGFTEKKIIVMISHRRMLHTGPDEC